MKRVTIRIDKVDRSFSYDFDNVVARDDVMTKLYSEHKQFKKQVELGQLDEMTDFHITWTNLDAMGQPIVDDETPTGAPTPAAAAPRRAATKNAQPAAAAGN